MTCLRFGAVLLACVCSLAADPAAGASPAAASTRAKVLCGLAMAEQDLGHYALAENGYLRAAALLGNDDPTLAYILDGLATDYVDLRLYAKAQQAANRALAIARDALPSGDPHCARILGHLAVIAAHRRRDRARRSPLGPLKEKPLQEAGSRCRLVYERMEPARLN